MYGLQKNQEGLHMERYANKSGQSGVTRYEITADSMTVLFKAGSRYLYTASSTGIQNVLTMQSLAKAGSGLNSYIMRNARMGYARK